MIKEEKSKGRQERRRKMCTDIDKGRKKLSNSRLVEKRFFDLHGTRCYCQEFMYALTLVSCSEGVNVCSLKYVAIFVGQKLYV